MIDRAQVILNIANLGKRIFDKDSAKTNIGTISGTTLLGIGVPMLYSSEIHLMAIGALVCASGVGLIWYREYKDKNEDEIDKNEDEIEENTDA